MFLHHTLQRETIQIVITLLVHPALQGIVQHLDSDSVARAIACKVRTWKCVMLHSRNRFCPAAFSVCRGYPHQSLIQSPHPLLFTCMCAGDQHTATCIQQSTSRKVTERHVFICGCCHEHQFTSVTPQHACLGSLLL